MGSGKARFIKISNRREAPEANMETSFGIPEFDVIPSYFPVHLGIKANTEFTNVSLINDIDDKIHDIKANAESYLAYLSTHPHLVDKPDASKYIDELLVSYEKLMHSKFTLQSLKQALRNTHRELMESRRHEQDLSLQNFDEYKEVEKQNFADKFREDLDATLSKRESEAFDTFLTGDASHSYISNAMFVLKNPLDPLPDEQADEDVAVEGGKISLKDPLSLNYFTEPVASTKCNHVFEKKYILRLMAETRSVDCPVTGCAAHLTPDDLRPDKLMALRVKSYLAKTQNKRRGSHEVVRI